MSDKVYRIIEGIFEVPTFSRIQVNVNGHENLVAEGSVQELRMADGMAVPVLAWRGDCGIYLAGSSGIVVRGVDCFKQPSSCAYNILQL